ncbi:MAG: DNA-directed RNA polymerase subunit delta [Candidatus Falkowbacteria bacterium]|nr:DNA-directed RNA polymerase subunit delta [Candidatus Falkowbacteria bacterium]
MENLLEKIIKEERSEEVARLNAISIVENLFTDLMDREKDIISRRFGFDGGGGETLEKIGQMHKLTRERVRQIEAASIKKIKKLENLESYIGVLKSTVKQLVNEHGGLVRQDYLLDILTVICLELNNEPDAATYETDRSIYKNHFHFLISRLLQDDLEVVDNSDEFNPSYKLKENEISHLEELADDLLKKVDGLKKTLTTEELLDLLKKLDSYNKHQEKLSQDSGLDITKIFKSQVFPDKAEIINNNKVLYSLMQAIRNLEQNKYGDWGLADWKEIKPKTINDKIYLVLKNQGEPMHFTEIAKKINEVKFDQKTANAATVHNELILDNRYVLVGRGVYGLREWKK